MKAEVVTMSFEPTDIAGLVVGVIFGTLFLAICIISAVKAVRDRREILKRMAERKAAKERRARGEKEPSPPAQPRRPKPNIKIIHDEERAERFIGRNKLKETSENITDPSSPHTETTTVEMDYSYDHSAANSDVDMAHQMSYKSKCSDASLTSKGTKVRFADNLIDDLHSRRVSTPRQSWSSPLIQAMWNWNTSNSSPDVRYDCDLGDIIKDGSPGPMQNGHSRGGGGHAMENGGVSASRSFHGFTKHLNGSNSASGDSQSRYVCANYNPRRNSYAAAIAANPSWIEMPPLKGHSHEAHYLSNCLPRKAQTSHNHVSAPGHIQEGADNPAYEGADDTVRL